MGLLSNEKIGGGRSVPGGQNQERLLSQNFGGVNSNLEGQLAKILAQFLEQNPGLQEQAAGFDFSALTAFANERSQSGSVAFDNLRKRLITGQEGLGQELFDRLSAPKANATLGPGAEQIGSFGAARRQKANQEQPFSRGFQAPIVTRGIKPTA